MKMTAENKRIRAANQTWLNRTAIIREAGKLDIKAENEAIARAAQEKAEWQYLNKEKLIDYLKNKEVQA